ncbi:NADP-dependent oxidoreductase [Paractinoplanes durhamensis]|uniref:NADP-dependent oxidoreductase n=1 Tax=Paractinoplanes durhamensis TaxID=113563 RepID=UPI00194581F8|nr:NADP-dependent oxidoreductase [Actinoplanes durhamensis]
MRIHEYGDASVIRQDEIPRPVPTPGEVLIRVAATSFNPSDIGIRRGLLKEILPMDLPYALGIDVAGTLVDGGDRVVGRVDTGGTAAEYVVAAADSLVAAPSTVPLAHAAALPIAGLTAWQAVFEHAELKPGRRVLINGAGGGVGGFAVQLAKYAGAYVAATASPRSAEVIRGLGADRIVDYTTEPLPDDVDVIINLVPDARLPSRGAIVSATGPVHFVARNDTAQLAALVELVDAGVVRIDIGAERPLSELADVHRDAEAGRTRGKVLLVP